MVSEKTSSKTHIEIKVVPCVVKKLTYYHLPLRSKPVEPIVGEYGEKSLNNPDHVRILTEILPKIHNEISRMYPQFDFDIQLMNTKEVLDSIEVTEEQLQEGSTDASFYVFSNETKDRLKEIYRTYAEKEEDDNNGLATRVWIPFWRAYGFHGIRLEEAGTPHMWAMALGDALTDLDGNEERLKQEIIHNFAHEFGHSLGLSHHKGDETCTNNKKHTAHPLRVCSECVKKIESLLGNSS